MLKKYLIAMLFFTLLLQASPKLFQFLANPIEDFQKKCKVYQKTSFLPKNIKKECKMYDSKVKRVFKLGYQLDPFLNSDDIDGNKVEKYKVGLDNLKEMQINILHLINNEKNKAKNQDNIKYFKKLLTINELVINSTDYNFMRSYIEQFNEHPKFISYEKKLCIQDSEKLGQEIEVLKEELFNSQLKNEENEKVIRDLKQEKQKIQMGHEKEIADFRESLKKAKEIILSLKDKEKANLGNQTNTKTQVKSLTSCKQDMVYASSSAENATDYALKGNHKYALIEVKEAILGTQLALDSCKGKVDALKMDELSKNLYSLNETKRKIEQKTATSVKRKHISSVDIARGAKLYEKCIGCHGANGEKKALGRSAIIKGQNIDKTVEQLKGYKEGALTLYGMGGLMKGQVSSFSEYDIQAIAAYISEMATSKNTDTIRATPQTSEYRKDSDVHGAWAYMQIFVEKQLKSPKSADFPFGGYRHVTDLGGGRYKVNSYVDSKNSFNATIRTHFNGVIKRKNGGWILEYLNFGNTQGKTKKELPQKNVVSIPNMSDTTMIKNCKEGCSLICMQSNSCNDSRWMKNCVYSCTH